MKYIVIVGDGMADVPIKALGNKTPLQVAKIPNMDFLAQNGCNGWVCTVPPHFEPASDIANMSILGINPSKYYCGRGPLEAINLGIKFHKNETIFRANFVYIKNQRMNDFTANHISNKMGKVLIDYLNKKFENTVKFYQGTSYRNLAVIKAHFNNLITIPPHNITDRKIYNYLPSGKDSSIIREIMNKSRIYLETHPLYKSKKTKANMVWLWGEGRTPKFQSFYSIYKLKGAIISEVDLIKGMGKSLGMEVINVPGATGYFDTDYENIARFGLSALKYNDFIFIHIEAPDEAGHQGDIKEKIRAIENIDKKVLGYILRNIKFKEFRILLLPDHKTPVSKKAHTSEPVPFVIYDSTRKIQGVTGYNESAFLKSKLLIKKGYKLLNYFTRTNL